MCLLFLTINRKHMNILQSINVFFPDPTRYIPQIRFVLQSKASYDRSAKIARRSPWCQMSDDNRGNKISKSAMDFGWLFIYAVYFPVLRKEPA